jgi:RNA polymerase sigma factor (sigma-70 family)
MNQWFSRDSFGRPAPSILVKAFSGRTKHMANASLGIVLHQLRGLVDPHPAAAASDSELLTRFSSGREEAAFAGLLRRHGPMVLAVCRRLLPNVQDAEDVFQAAFLLLARKAASIRKGESVSSWLHSVAYRLAIKARARVALQRRREQQAAARRTAEAGAKAAWRELEAVLDDELERLPPAFRAPLVLCYLEGQTQEEASRRLGCPLGTVRSRLARARKLLRGRLARRGLTLSAAALATALAAHSAAAALPARLFQDTLQAGLPFAAGQGAGGVSAQAAALAERGLKTLTATKLIIGLTVLLTVGLITTGAAVLARGTWTQSTVPAGSALVPPPARTVGADPPAKAGPKDQGQKPLSPKGEDKRQTITGQVLAADGKPAAHALVAALAHVQGALETEAGEQREQVLGNTRADRRGRFRLTVRRIDWARLDSLQVMAGAAGQGLGWKALQPAAAGNDVEIRLWPEQPLRGRLVDLQGNPAAKVTVHLSYVVDPKARAQGVGLWEVRQPLSPWPKPVTTDVQGRFVLPGLGRNLLVGLRIRDDHFGPQDLHRISTQDGKEVTLLLEGPRVVEGRVTFADTSKPALGVRLRVTGYTKEVNQPTFENGSVSGQADSKGRFRLLSFPGNTIHISARAPAGTPYLDFATDLTWPKGAVKQQVQVTLPRGVLVRGRVTEAASGKPIRRVQVEFWPHRTNLPYLRPEAVTEVDGSFQVGVPAVPGSLLFQSTDRNYIQRLVYRNLMSGAITAEPVVYPKMKGVKIGAQILYPDGQPLYVDGWHELNLKPGAKSAEVKVVLRRGLTVHGRLLGPDGKPAAKTRMLCRLPMGSLGFITLTSVEVWEGRFTLTGCDPEKTYPVFFLDPEHQWGAVAHIAAKRGADKPPTVRLAPCGSAVVQVRNGQGRPRPNHRLNPYGIDVVLPPATATDPKAPRQKLPLPETIRQNSLDWMHYGEGLQTDAQGKVTLPALIPGATYQLIERGQLREFKAESGRQVKLADIVIP